MTKFLDQIGSVNASYIRFLRMEFVAIAACFWIEHPLKRCSIEMLEKLVLCCTSLETLIISPGRLPVGHWLYVPIPPRNERPSHSRSAMRELNSYFRRIASLREIVIEIHDGVSNPIVMEEMETYGWRVKVVKRAYVGAEGF